MPEEQNGEGGSPIKGFSGIVGQDAAVEVLKRVLRGRKIPHAFLFTGIPGAGKTTTALAFARALNCERPVDGDGCGRCIPCRQMAGGNFPDLEILRPDGRVIRIEQVRELTRRVGFKTVSGRYRVCIVERAEAMNVEAANAFLKTLEEPPPGNVLILQTLEKKDLLPTILSRCRKVPFHPVPAAVLAGWLSEEAGLSAETASVLARLSEGSVGRALRMACSTELMERRASHIQVVTGLPARPSWEILSAAVEYSAQEKKRSGGTDPSEEEGLSGVLALWKTSFRDMLILKSGGAEDLLVLGDEDGALKRASRFYTIDGLVESVSILDRAQRDLGRSRNLDLLMETTLLCLKRVAGPAGTAERTGTG